MIEKVFRILLLVFLTATSPVFGQDVLFSEAVENESITIEQIDSALLVLESRQGLDEGTRSKVTEHLIEAQLQIQNRLDAEAATQEYSTNLETAPAETAKLRTTLDEPSLGPPTAESFGIDANTTLSELQQLLTIESADYASTESGFAELKDQVEATLVRPAAARERIAELRQRREEFASIISAQSDPSEQQILENARKLSAQLSRAAQTAEISKLEQELLTHTVRVNLLQAKRDLAARTLLESGQRVAFLRNAVDNELQAAAVRAQEAADAAKDAVADKHPVVRSLAEFNADLTRELPQRAADVQELGVELEQLKAEALDIEQRLTRSERRLEIGGLSRILGSLLIAERRSLPQPSQYQSDIISRNREAGRIGLERIRVQEQRRELASLDQRVQEYIARISRDVVDERELAAYEDEVRELLRSRRDLLVDTENSYGAYLQILGNVDIEQRHLLEVTDRYRQFLAENLLWIPSAPFIGVGIWQDGLPAMPKALSPGEWLGVSTHLVRSVGQHVAASVFCLTLLIFWLLLRKPLARKFVSMSERVGRLSTDSIMLTVWSLLIVAFRALPVPFLFAATGWFLSRAVQSSDFVSSVGQSMTLAAPFVFHVILFRLLSAPGGLLIRHFGWQEEHRALVRQQLDRLVFVGVPMLFATIVLFYSDVESDRATVGRLVFIAIMFFFSSVIRQILHPDTGIAASYYRRHSQSLLAKFRWATFSVAVGMPIILAAISSLGFLYTSTILAGLMVDTLWTILSLTVVYLVVLRWSALARRKLGLQQALKEREARRAEQQDDADQEENPDAAAVAEVPLDLDEVDQQTKKMLRSIMVVVAAIAVWNIWAYVLPAFSFLNDVGLWNQTVTISGVETVVPVTLADLLLAVLVIVVTAIASRNLPGLMEIAFLQRMTLAPGSRYAINTLARYFVVTVGTFVVLGLIGWNWGQIQWLVAALSVGLGFGLQEIVANFVSGLVILFERPIRVGDTVTVGELTGTVSKVRIRATTITDWDRKEILVPNKAFITQQVTNWTLSDPITRVVIPVGVSYGSDAELTHKVILETLDSLPLVLDEPAPRAYFTGFGDSSLNFTLHAYLRQLSDRMPLVHDVHEAVLKALRENGIEIPFPQRDIHIRSTVKEEATN